MHMIVAIIQPTKLSTVKQALVELGIEDLNISEASGYGRQRGQTASFRGNEYHVELLRKLIIEFVVSDLQLDSVIDVVSRAAKTGKEGEIGDGKVFVMPIAEAIEL